MEKDYELTCIKQVERQGQRRLSPNLDASDTLVRGIPGFAYARGLL